MPTYTSDTRRMKLETPFGPDVLLMVTLAMIYRGVLEATRTPISAVLPHGARDLENP